MGSRIRDPGDDKKTRPQVQKFHKHVVVHAVIVVAYVLFFTRFLKATKRRINCKPMSPYTFY